MSDGARARISTGSVWLRRFWRVHTTSRVTASRIGSAYRSVRLRRTSFGTTSETLFTFARPRSARSSGSTQIFGANHLNLRFHRDLTTITIESPDRKGSRKVVITAGGNGQCQFTVGEDDQHVVEFLERVRGALPAGRPLSAWRGWDDVGRIRGDARGVRALIRAACAVAGEGQAVRVGAAAAAARTPRRSGTTHGRPDPRRECRARRGEGGAAGERRGRLFHDAPLRRLRGDPGPLNNIRSETSRRWCVEAWLVTAPKRVALGVPPRRRVRRLRAALF